MQHFKKSDAQILSYFEDTVQVSEFGSGGIINDAEIILAGRYPDRGYAVNDISTALISVELGAGSVSIKGSDAHTLEQGDRVIIEPGEPYCLIPTGRMAIRYIATPAWSAEQSRIVDG